MEGNQDLFVELAKQKVSLTPNENYVKAALAPKIPAFLYELLDENLIKEETKKILLKAVPNEDKYMLSVIWRFGRILRKKNKMIRLHIKIDSAFLNYYGFPDFISDYDKFAETFVYPKFERPENLFLKGTDLYGKMKLYTIPTLILMLFTPSLINSAIVREIPLTDAEKREIQVNNVPPEFIYVKIIDRLVPISKVTEEYVPLI